MVVQVSAFAESKDHGKRLACTADITFVAVIKDENGDLIKFDHNLSTYSIFTKLSV